MPSIYELPAMLIPKYSMTGPFKGHRSMKSSPLFPGSSCSLSTQFIIQDHMATHYRKLNSAKAAVDTSAPKSLSSSVKFRDQQNKDRLLRAVQTFKKELQHLTSNLHSKSNFPEKCKVQYGGRDMPMAATERLSGEPKTSSPVSTPVLIAREVMRSIEKGNRHYGDGEASFQPQTSRASLHQGLSRKKPYKDPQKQTYGGDLLEKHAASFTSFKKPFKPRLLKKSTHSFLIKYRYYTTPTKKNIKNPPSPQADERDMNHLTELYRSWEDIYSPLEIFSHMPRSRTENPTALEMPHSRLQQEEELIYLNFLEELTNDLILKGYGSSSAMEHVFQDHLKRNQHNIDEVKKKILVRELKDELERSVRLDFSISYDGAQYGSRNLPLTANLSRLLKV